MLKAWSVFALMVIGCASDANSLGVGAECSASSACDEGQACVTRFGGGYCGLTGCAHDADCPSGSACVTHDGANYCFLVCNEKVECNVNRSVANESNCSSGAVDFVDPAMGRKVCVPPSNGG